MRVFVAGATGAIGRRLIPLLVEVGHGVTGSSRTESGVTRLRGQGADGVQVNVFDRDALRAAVAAAAPEVVVHQLTALSQGSAADNARIRRDGTRNLVDAARQAGVTRMVAQSIAWAYAPGRGPAVESTALDVAADPPRSVTVGGVVALEQAVAELDQHVILRFGLLYGPGTWYRRDGRMAHQLAGGAFVATGGVSSFVHVDDAARATVLALGWPSGPVNVVDDEPASAHAWAPAFANAVGAPEPPRVDGAAGWERGADNTLARKGRGWQPLYPSWCQGFTTLT
jgi:nucleoside-diphosphate-sugar epimerase